MPIIQSFGALQALSPPLAGYGPASSSSVALYGKSQAYKTLYATQPNVRTCVDFLARNIAHLGLHAFRRISDTDRERLAGHRLTNWLSNPNPGSSGYRLIESMIADYALYLNAYWLKIRGLGFDGRDLGLVRLPADEVTVEGSLLPTGYIWTVGGRQLKFPLTEVVHFHGYNPLSTLTGLSPLETLRRILAEEAAAGEHREQYWRNAGRQEGVIEVSTSAPKWNDTQKQAFREQWQEFSGNGARAGQTPILPVGMTIKANSFSPRDSEYLAARKLTREECAAMWQIPLPMVGILDHATYSNIREQHKHMYQDCLGPWLEMVQQELERQLLPECDDVENVYLEFNIAEKLKGSFEEQAASLQMAVGRPLMTGNEGRARLNLPRHDDPTMDEVAPQQGGPAAFGVDPFAVPRPAPRADVVDITPALTAARQRQASKLTRVPAAERPVAFLADLPRWDRELEADLLALAAGDPTPRLDPIEARRLARLANAETLMRLQDEAQ